LGSVIIQLYAGECTPSVDRLKLFRNRRRKTRTELLWTPSAATRKHIMVGQKYFKRGQTSV